MRAAHQIKTLECSVCGRECRGRQWWNRDKGTGICERCVESEEAWAKKFNDPDYMRKLYGRKGIYYNIKE